jgi:hypothetical protein
MNTKRSTSRKFARAHPGPAAIRTSEPIIGEVYDGRWDRHYGTDGGQALTEEGHGGFIAVRMAGRPGGRGIGVSTAGGRRGSRCCGEDLTARF